MAIKVCSRCKKQFTCSNEKPGCWCEKLTIDATTLKHLKAEFDNCLCKDCLQIYSTKV